MDDVEIDTDMDVGTSDTGGWLLQNISPTTFNVISDLLAQALTGVLMLALGVAYPYLVWRSVARGGGISLGSLMAPPHSLYGKYASGIGPDSPGRFAPS